MGTGEARRREGYPTTQELGSCILRNVDIFCPDEKMTRISICVPGIFCHLLMFKEDAWFVCINEHTICKTEGLTQCISLSRRNFLPSLFLFFPSKPKHGAFPYVTRKDLKCNFKILRIIEKHTLLPFHIIFPNTIFCPKKKKSAKKKATSAIESKICKRKKRNLFDEEDENHKRSKDTLEFYFVISLPIFPNLSLLLLEKLYYSFRLSSTLLLASFLAVL